MVATTGPDRRAVVTRHGVVSYLATTGAAARRGLFVHGLGCDGSFFAAQAAELDLGFLPWLVPDLLGHGASARPTDPLACRMESQAAALADLLTAEGVAEVVLVAHSMGGPVALRLAEVLETEGGARPVGLVYAEGNLDENDAFLSRGVAEQPWEAFEAEGWPALLAGLERQPGASSYLRTLRSAGPRAVHASSVSLVAHSREAVTTALLRRLDCPKLFLFGERNQGRFTSEGLARRLGEVLFVPGAGHAMHEENPPAFWGLVRDFARALPRGPAGVCPDPPRATITRRLRGRGSGGTSQAR